MSLILGFIHQRSVRKLPFAESKKAIGVHQVRNVELSLPYDETFTLCLRSLNSIEKSRVQRKNRSQGKIVAKTGMTWKTFGDTISFKLFEVNNEQTQIKVSSKPIVPTTLVDYGTNLENVEKIIRVIEEHGGIAVR